MNDYFAILHETTDGSILSKRGDLVVLKNLTASEIFEKLGNFDPFSIVSSCSGKILMILGPGDLYVGAAGAYFDFGFGDDLYEKGENITMETVRCLCDNQIYDVPIILIDPFIQKK